MLVDLLAYGIPYKTTAVVSRHFQRVGGNLQPGGGMHPPNPS
jgi:hypothetical protein